MHKKGAFSNLQTKEVHKIYQYLYIVVEKHEQYKKAVSETEFEKLISRIAA